MFVTTRSTQPLRPLRLMLSTLLLLASAALCANYWAQNAGTVLPVQRRRRLRRYAVDTNSVGVGVNMPLQQHGRGIGQQCQSGTGSASIPAC